MVYGIFFAGGKPLIKRLQHFEKPVIDNSVFNLDMQHSEKPDNRQFSL
jgi:hypothetical protein